MVQISSLHGHLDLLDQHLELLRTWLRCTWSLLSLIQLVARLLSSLNWL